MIHLRGPSGNAVGTELEDMFTRISHKRLAAAPESAAHPETYLGAPTPAGEGLEPFGGFDYDVDIGTGGFDRERFEQTVRAIKYLLTCFLPFFDRLKQKIPALTLISLEHRPLKLLTKALAEHSRLSKALHNSMESNLLNWCLPPAVNPKLPNAFTRFYC